MQTVMHLEPPDRGRLARTVSDAAGSSEHAMAKIMSASATMWAFSRRRSLQHEINDLHRELRALDDADLDEIADRFGCEADRVSILAYAYSTSRSDRRWMLAHARELRQFGSFCATRQAAVALNGTLGELSDRSLRLVSRVATNAG